MSCCETPNPNDTSNAATVGRGPSGRYMSVEEVAAYLGFSSKAVRHRVAQATIPYRKLGGRLLFDRVTIDAWYQSLPGVSKTEAQRKAG